MEVTNNSQHFTIPLVVGRRIAQMVFYEVEPINDADYVAEKGKYQAVTREVGERSRKGQPILIGTIAIEKSELLSKYLNAEALPLPPPNYF